MANTILSSFTKRQPFRAVDESNGYAQWSELAVLSVEIIPEAAITNQPLETSELMGNELYGKILDEDVKNGKVIQPIKLRVKALLAELSVMEELMRSFTDVTATYMITSKSIIADNMVMIDLQFNQSSEMLSVTEVVLEFERAYPSETGAYDPNNAANESGFGFRFQDLPPAFPTSISGTFEGAKSEVQRLVDKISKLRSAAR